MVAQIDLIYARHRPSKIVSRIISYAFFEGRPLTTRGQWINPILFHLFDIQKRLPQIKKVTEPLFILGMGRSGTTILGKLLSMHCQVGFLNEPKALWHSIVPNEDVIGNYTRNISRYRLLESDSSDQIIRDAHRVFGFYLASVFSERLVDKYPEHLFRIPFLRTIFPDAKFLLLVRNGWDTCVSVEQWCQRYSKRVNGETHDWWGVNRRKWNIMLEELVFPDSYFFPIRSIIHDIESRVVDMAALEWIVTMREALRVLQAYKDIIHRVDYERLVSSPRETLSQIASFANYCEDDIYLSYGDKVLRPSPSHRKVDIHYKLSPLFEDTLMALGYR